MHSIDEAIAYFSTLREFAPRTGRERFRALLSLLGNPHQQLRCLHVAGTNGKGSTVTFLSSVLKEAGYKVGAYFSPFVFDVRERWQIGGALIPPDELVRQVSEIRPHIEALAQTEFGQITEFELKTAIAFRWFAEQKVDFAVIEVGIGGRLDSTNVIPPPLVSVITSIGWDHQHLLGDTAAKIAMEKAGVIKNGSLACITAVPPGEAWNTIAAKAHQESVPLITVGDQEAQEMRSLSLSLHGEFQYYNSAVAAAALRTLRNASVTDIPEAVLQRGLETATLPGRFQYIPPRTDNGFTPIILDVAHNTDAARVLAESIRRQFGAGKNVTLVLGMSKTHEPGPFLAEIAPLVRRVIATAPRFRPRPAEEVAAAAELLGLPVTVISSIEAAIQQATQVIPEQGENKLVLVTGSFYTVGEYTGQT